ncbi:hypothetical protein OSTOST_13323, partial [Ostertagia ostertagi]
VRCKLAEAVRQTEALHQDDIFLLTAITFFQSSAYLRCNRAGRGTATATKRMKVTRKDTAYCPCFLNVQLRNDGSVVTKGCFGHAGHSLEPALLRLSVEHREFLKQLLEEHTIGYILERLRNEYRHRNPRLFFVTKDDLKNLVEKYNLRPGRRHHNDLTSVSLRVQEGNPLDGIRLYVPPDDPSGRGLLMGRYPQRSKFDCIFSLTKYSSDRDSSSTRLAAKVLEKGVLVSTTLIHTTRYHIKLATLVVPDEKDRGLPAGFLISGTMTAVDVAKFFDVIKQLIPDFEPETIVTDEAPCFWNGFRLVFRKHVHDCTTVEHISHRRGRGKSKN